MRPTPRAARTMMMCAKKNTSERIFAHCERIGAHRLRIGRRELPENRISVR
jgi:hypothetical protein